MMLKLEWNGPVEPGRGMLGLPLGLSLSAVRSLLGEAGSVVSNTPGLSVDYQNEHLIFLRAANMPNCPYDWQNIMARIMFEQGQLSGIMVHGNLGDEDYTYKGKLFGKAGLGSRVSDLLEFGCFEYDDVEEVFFSEQWHGIEIGGAGACDLIKNPEQVITTLNVYLPK
jgi:hypothetical protein